MELAPTMGDRPSPPPTVERLIAVGYGLTYDAIVRGFAPYEAMLDEIVALMARAAAPGPPLATRILDVSCGTGTAAERLARRGWSVVGLDSVAHLIAVARRRHRDSGLSLSFQHADIAHDAVPAAGSYDALLSMHTLYWHPDPGAMLAACRRVLKPGGHALFLTYERPARVLHTFRDVRARHGAGAAVGALRWLLPTALFELFRGARPRYLNHSQFTGALKASGFDVLEVRQTFLAGISLLAWARVNGR